MDRYREQPEDAERIRPRHNGPTRARSAASEPAGPDDEVVIYDDADPETERRAMERRAAEEDRRAAARRAEDARLASIEQRQHIIGRITVGVDYLFYLLYGLLGIRFVLSLLGASETAGFVQFIQGITAPFYGPFAGIVARPAVNGGFLDFPLLIAVLAYALLHIAIRGLLRFIAGTGRVA
jgi:uncharacterized protein YggT (Ycf19 family)